MTSADITARIKKQPIGVACGLIALACAGWLYYRSDEIENRQKEYEAKSAEAAKFISNVSISKSLPAEVAEMQAATKELEGRLIKASQQALNQQFFYKLEAETEVKLLDVRQSPPRNPKAAYIAIPFNVNIQGPYGNVMTFLQRLEKGRPFCRINQATFTKAAEGTAMTLSLTLEMLGQP